MDAKLSDRIYKNKKDAYITSKFLQKSTRLNDIDTQVKDLYKKLDEYQNEKFYIGRDLLFLEAEMNLRELNPFE
jgi:hypothetical protein